LKERIRIIGGYIQEIITYHMVYTSTEKLIPNFEVQLLEFQTYFFELNDEVLGLIKADKFKEFCDAELKIKE